MNPARTTEQIDEEQVWDASHALAMRLRVDKLLKDAEQAPGLAVKQLQAISDLVTTGRLADADAAWQRLYPHEQLP